MVMELEVDGDDEKDNAKLISNRRETLVFFDNPENVPMEFVVICKEPHNAVRMCQMIEKHGGRASTNLADCGPHSAVLVEVGINTRILTRCFLTCCFKMSYIKDCLIKRQVLNISPYLIRDVENERCENIDYFDIIYFRSSSWISISQTQRSKPSEETPSKNVAAVHVDDNRPGPSTRGIEVTRRPTNAPIVRLNYNDCKSGPSVEVLKHSNRSNTRSDIRKRSLDEIDDSESSIEATDIIRPPRTRIKYITDSGSSTEEAECSSETNNNVRRNNNDESNSSSSSDEEANVIRRTKKLTVCSGNEENTDSDSGDSFNDIEVLRRPVQKRPKRDYTRKEKEAIVKYIVNNSLYDNVGGVKMWKDMENAKVLPERTWQSIKEHFRRTIVKEIHKFTFLSTSQKRRLVIPPKDRKK